MVNGRKSAALISWVNCMCAEQTESLWDLKDLSIYLHIIQTIKGSVDVKPLLKSSKSEKRNYIRDFLHQFFQKNACLQTVDWDGLTVGEQVELELAKLTVAFLCCAVVSTDIQSRMKFLDPDTQVQLHDILKFVMDNEESPQLQFDLELLLNVGCVVRSPRVVSAACVNSGGRFSSPVSALPPGHGAGVRFRDLQRVASSSSMNNLPSSPGSPSSPMLSFFEQPDIELRRLKQQLRQEWEQREELEAELSGQSRRLQQSEQEAAELRGRVERLVQLTRTRAPSPLPCELVELQEKTQRLSLTVKQCQELKKENELMEKRLTQLAEENSELSCKVRESCSQLAECRVLLEESGRGAERRHAQAKGRIRRLEEALAEALNGKASLEETVRILQGKLAAHAETEAATKEQRDLPPGEVMSEILQLEEWHMCQRARERAQGWTHSPDRQPPPGPQAHAEAVHGRSTLASSREEQPCDRNASNPEGVALLVRDRKFLMPNEGVKELEGSVVDQDDVTLREDLDGRQSKRTSVSPDIGVEATLARSSALKHKLLEGSALSHGERGVAMDVQENVELTNDGHREILERDRMLLQQERTALNREREIIEEEKAALEKERMSVIAMNEVSRSTVTDHMSTTRATMEQERATLDQEKITLDLEKAALKAMQDEIQFNSWQQKSSLDQDKSNLEQDMIILKRRWKCLEGEQARLVTERAVQEQDKASFTEEIVSLKALLVEERSIMKAGLERERILIESEREKILERVTAQQKDVASLQQERITMQQEVKVLEQAREALACIVTSLDKMGMASSNEKGSIVCVLEQGMATLKAILGLDWGIACKETYAGTPDNTIAVQIPAVPQQQRIALGQNDLLSSGKHGMGQSETGAIFQIKDDTNTHETSFDEEMSSSHKERLVSLERANDVLTRDQADFEAAADALLTAAPGTVGLTATQETAAGKDIVGEDGSLLEQEKCVANVRNQKAFTPAETLCLAEADLGHERIAVRDSLQREVAALEQKRCTLTASLRQESRRLRELEEAVASAREADGLKVALRQEAVTLRTAADDERIVLEEMKCKVREDELSHSQEKIKLQRDRDSLQVEKAFVERETVALERMRAAVDEMKAVREREGVDVVAPLEREKVALKRELTALHTQRAEWSAERARLVREQAVLKQQWAALQQEKEALDRDRDNLKVASERERAALSETVSKLQLDNSHLHAEKTRLERDMAELGVIMDETRLARQGVELDNETADNELVRLRLDREMTFVKKEKNLLDQTVTTFASEKTDYWQLQATVENKTDFTTLAESDCIVLEPGQTGWKQGKELVASENATKEQERDVYKARREHDAVTSRQAADAMSSGRECRSVASEQRVSNAAVDKTRQAATQRHGTGNTASPEKVNAALLLLCDSSKHDGQPLDIVVFRDQAADTEIQDISRPGATAGRQADWSEKRRESMNSSVVQGTGNPGIERGVREKRKENLGEDEEVLAATVVENVDTTMQSELATDETPSDIRSERDMPPSDLIITKEEFRGATLQASVSESENNFDTDMERLRISSNENMEQTPSEDGRRHSMITRSARKRSSGRSQETLYFTPLQARASLGGEQTPALDWSLDSLGDLVIDSAKKKPRTSSARRRTTHIIDITLNKKVESCRRDSMSSVSTTRTTTAYTLRPPGDGATPLQRSDWSFGIPGSSASFVTLGTFASQNSLQLEDPRCRRLSDASLRSLPGYRPLAPLRPHSHHLEQPQAPLSTRRRKGNASYYMSCVDEPDPEAEWDELERRGLAARAPPPREPRAAPVISAGRTEVSQGNQPPMNCKMDFSEKSDAKNNHSVRQKELQGCNQAAPPHPRSGYPLEVEAFMPGADPDAGKPEITARGVSLRPAIANADTRKRKSGLGHNAEGSPESKKPGSACFAVPATPREKLAAPRASPRHHDPHQSSWPIIRRLRRSMSRKKSPSSKASKP